MGSTHEQGDMSRLVHIESYEKCVSGSVERAKCRIAGRQSLEITGGGMWWTDVLTDADHMKT